MASSTASSGGMANDINLMRQRASMLDFSRQLPVGTFLGSLADRLEGANEKVQGQCLKLMESVVVASEWLLKPESIPKNIAPAYIAKATQSVKSLGTFLGTGEDGQALDQLPQLVCDVDNSVTQALAAGAVNPANVRQPGPATFAAAPEVPPKDVPGADKGAPAKR